MKKDANEPIPHYVVLNQPKRTPKPVHVYAVVRSEVEGMQYKNNKQIPRNEGSSKTPPILRKILPDGMAKPLGEDSSILVRGSRVTLELAVADFDSPFRWALDNFLQRKSGYVYRLPDRI